MTDEEKWNASLACDPACDGRFYYGVLTTGIFCRPSCKSKSPKRENVVFFDTPQQAAASGLRPCKRCRPDLLEYEPQKESAEKIRQVCELYFADQSRLKTELRSLGLSRNRMSQLFLQEYGRSPSEYLSELRVAKARELLTESRYGILELALHSGYESLSAFYSQFRRLTGVSPKQYRESFPRKEERG